MIGTWTDSRSGLMGCVAGNMVLQHLQKKSGERIVHEKGTVFSTPTRVFVGRICATDQYLQKGVAHLCNMSKDQHQDVLKYGKQIVYLFVTVVNGGSRIRFWAVPGRTISRILSSLPPKPSSNGTFIRIIEEDDGRFFIENTDITNFVQTIPLRSNSVRTIRSKVREQRRQLQLAS